MLALRKALPSTGNGVCSSTAEAVGHRVLVLSVSAGSGHVRAAEALCAHAKTVTPDLHLRHRDVMHLVPSAFRKIYTDWYIKLASNFPDVWGWLYRVTDREPTDGFIGKLRRALQRVCTKRLLTEIADFAPTAIICTHFLPADLLSEAIEGKNLKCSVWVLVTDFDVHQLWIHPTVDGYFVANEELAYRLQAAGIPQSKILVTGIPVMPDFGIPPERNAGLQRLGLDPTRRTVLMMGGGAGMGLSAALIGTLLQSNPTLQFIVIAGKNQSLFESLDSLSSFAAGRLIPIGFTDKVAELMACADLVVTKPGGLSTSECLVTGRPMLLINPIPGQEERNATYLLQEGAAFRADDEATLVYRLRTLVGDEDRLAAMQRQCLQLARPAAAHDILQQVALAIRQRGSR